MANRNIFEALNATPEGGAPKNPFDLHNFEWLTSKAGQFVPVSCREVVPDGTYDMSVDNYTLTFPCNTASQADMKENYYFVFVPFYQITRSAYAFTVQRKDNHSALDYQFEQMPSFPLGTVVRRCIEIASVGEADSLEDASMEDFIDIHGFNIGNGALRLLDNLGYGCYLDMLAQYKAYVETDPAEGDKPSEEFLDELEEYLNKFKPNALRIAAYQKIWYCYFRNSMYDNAISPRSFNFDDVTYPSDTTYNILDYRSVDEFILECLQLRYVQNKKDIVSACMPGTQFGAVSSVMLTSDLTGDLETGQPSYVKGSASTWPDQSTKAYDSQHDTAGMVGYAVAGVDTTNKRDSFYMNGFTSEGEVYVQLRTPHTHTGELTLGGAGQSLFDVLQLVESQAIQKWRQEAMLAGSRTRDNWKAHYGVVPRHMVDDYPDFIGSVDNLIQISQVISQANTLTSEAGKTNLGDIAGRGYGASDNKSFRFHATEYGVVMLCRAVVSENVYASFGLDRANQLIYYTDFWQPEYQNIGLEAVPKNILDSFYPMYPDSVVDPTGEGGDSPLPANSTVIGYAPRNYQLKHYRSKVHGLFNPARLQDLTIPTPESEIGNIGFGQLESFVQIRRDVVQHMVAGVNGGLGGYGITIGLSQLYVNPSVTNSTFAFDADSSEETDTFIHKCRVNFTAVQPLSVLGMPQF